MNARRIAYFIGGFTLVGSGAYVLIYLYRWEWHRAIVAGVFFLGTEIALAAAVILERLQGLRSLVVAGADSRELERIQETAPDPKRHFAWLEGSDEKLGVFVPILMGTGLLLSAAAWAVERIAARTARPALERRLAARLRPLSFTGGFLPEQSLGSTGPSARQVAGT